MTRLTRVLNASIRALVMRCWQKLRICSLAPLEALTIPVSELVKADHGASQDKPSEVNIGAALIADAQTPEVFSQAMVRSTAQR